MTVSTPNYHWSMPDPGGSANTWGNLCNGVFTAIDTSLWNINANTGYFASWVSVNGGVTTSGFNCTDGYTITTAPSGGDAFFVMNDSAGAERGWVGWGHANNSVSLLNNTGGGAITINADGSVSTSGAFHTQAINAAGVSCTGALTSGAATVNGTLSVSGYATVAGLSSVGNAAISGQLNVSGGVFAGNSSFTGLTVNGSAVCAGLLTAQSSINATGQYNLTQSGVSDFMLNFYAGGGGYVAKVGIAGNTTSNFIMATNYVGAYLQIDTSGSFSYNGGTGIAYKNGGGSWAALSDARIKDVTGDYTRGLDDVLQLRPIIYRYKGNDTSHPDELSPHKNVAERGQSFVGLIAQEVEAIFPDMVSKGDGFIDGRAVSDLRALDTSELLYALVNSVKELKAEIEALKAAR